MSGSFTDTTLCLARCFALACHAHDTTGYSLHPSNHIIILQARNTPQRLGQDSSQEPSLDRKRMAWNWRSAKPGLATLCDSSVRFLLSKYFLLTDYRPEPHILLFRRPLGTDPQSGRVDPELAAAAREEYKNQFALRNK